MSVKDIIINEDIEFSGGDLKVDFSDSQHVEHIITAERGQFYQFPLIGFGVNKLRHGNFTGATIRQLIKEQLEADNYRVNSVEVGKDVDNLELTIDATRKR